MLVVGSEYDVKISEESINIWQGSRPVKLISDCACLIADAKAGVSL